MMKNALAASAGLLLALVPISAAAQNGAMWVDRYGRMMSLMFGGGNGAPPAPIDRPAEQMAGLFQSLCVATEGDPARISAAAEAARAGLTAQPQNVPGGGRNAPPIVLDIWRGEGLVVTRTTGFFAAPVAQCSTIFYVNALPDRQAMFAALTAALGSQPTNGDRAVRRNGQPNPGYIPEWAAGGRIIVVHIAAGNSSMPGNRVHIAIRAR